MADLSITAAEVLWVSGPKETKNAKVAITAGEVVFDSAGEYDLADNDVDEATANARGIALNNAAAGQPLSIINTSGVVTLGASALVVEGAVYVLSSTAGGIAPAADLGSSDYTTVLGVGNGANGLDMAINASGEQTA